MSEFSDLALAIILGIILGNYIIWPLAGEFLVTTIKDLGKPTKEQVFCGD